jgi:uncharacterized Zn-binding protein involved in type VI secretion
MPGYLLDLSATVQCMHAGTATPIQTSLHVKISGQAIVTLTSSYTVAGCSLTPPPPKPFCATAQFTSGATKLKSDGVPVLLKDSQAVCATTGTGVQIASTQTKVKGT